MIRPTWLQSLKSSIGLRLDRQKQARPCRSGSDWFTAAQVELLEKRELLSGTSVVHVGGLPKSTIDGTLPNLQPPATTVSWNGSTYALGTDNTVYQQSSTGWTPISAPNVVSFNGSPTGPLCALQTNGTFCQYTGHAVWQTVDTAVTKFELAPSSSAYAGIFFTLTTAGNLDINGAVQWANTKDFAFGPDGSLYTLGTGGLLQRLPRGFSGGSAWQNIDTGIAQFNLSSNGSLFATKMNNAVFTYSVSGTAWTATPSSAQLQTSPAGQITTLTPTVSWQPVSGSAGYGLTLFDQTTQEFVLSHTFISNKYYTVPGGLLASGHSYAWQVASVNTTATIGQASVSTPVLFTTPSMAASIPCNFYIGPDGQVYSQIVTPNPSTAAVTFKLTAPGQVLALQVDNNNPASPIVFVIGMDHQVYYQRFDSNGNSLGYQLAAAGTVRSISVANTPSGQAELFVLGMGNQSKLGLADYQVSTLVFSTGGVPSGSYSLAVAGDAVKSLLVGHDAAGDPLAFVMGNDGQVYEDFFNSSGVSSGAYTLTASGAVKSISVAYSAFNTPELVAIGMNNLVYTQGFTANGNSTGGYVLTSNSAVQSATVGFDTIGNPLLFVEGMDGQVYENTQVASNFPTSGYQLIAHGAVKSFTAENDSSGNPRIFVVGLDGNNYEERFNISDQPVGSYFPVADVATTGTYSPTATGAIYTLGAAGNANIVYQYVGQENWTPISGADVISFTVAPNGTLYDLAKGNLVYQYTGANGVWTPISGTDVMALDMAPNGTLFSLAFGNVLYEYTGAGGVWTGIATTNPIYPNEYKRVVDNWITTSLPDPVIQSIVRADFDVNQPIVRGVMLHILTEVSNEGSVSASTISSLSELCVGSSFLGMPSYVSYLTSQIADGNPANSTCKSPYSSTGNLFIGCNSAQVGLLTNDWFLGGGSFSWAGTVPASPATGTLFGNGGPSFADVYQGSLGDCTLMASLAEVAARAPQDITNMFIANGDGTYTVRFYDQGVPAYVTVNNNLPGGGTLYAHVVNNILWPALAEKAVVQVNEEGWLGTLSPGSNSYAALNNGSAGTTVAYLSAITGLPSSALSVNPSNVAAAWNSGKFIVLDSGNTLDPLYIEHNHAYAMIGYNASSTMPFMLFNPWGVPGGRDATGQFYYGEVNINGAALTTFFSTSVNTSTEDLSADALLHETSLEGTIPLRLMGVKKSSNGFAVRV